VGYISIIPDQWKKWRSVDLKAALLIFPANIASRGLPSVDHGLAERRQKMLPEKPKKRF
jgi:hypothetical protein